MNQCRVDHAADFYIQFRLDYSNFRLVSGLAEFTIKIENSAQCMNYG